MNALVFLALALAVSVLGTIVLWVRNRDHDTPDASIAEFRSKMQVLSEDETRSSPGHSSGRRGG